MIILSFDTGYNIGWSVVDTSKLRPKLLCYDIWCLGSKLSMETFCKLTSDCVINKLHTYPLLYTEIDQILIEKPEYYGDKKGTIALKTGKLFYTYASAITIFNFSKNKNTKLITPNSWKGNLKKNATELRVKLILKNQLKGILKLPNYKKEHIIDSIGMGLSQNEKLWSLKV